LPDQFLCIACAPIILAVLALEAVPTRKAEHRVYCSPFALALEAVPTREAEHQVSSDQFLCISSAPLSRAALVLEAVLAHEAEHHVC
jgi:hypothetical protein